MHGLSITSVMQCFREALLPPTPISPVLPIPPNIPAALWLGNGLSDIFCQHRSRGLVEVLLGHGCVGGMVTGVGLLALDKALHKIGAGDFGEGSLGNSAEQRQGQQYHEGTASWSGCHGAYVYGHGDESGHENQRRCSREGCARGSNLCMRVGSR